MINHENRQHVISLPEQLNTAVGRRLQANYGKTWDEMVAYSGKAAYSAFRLAYIEDVVETNPSITDSVSGVTFGREDGYKAHHLFAERVIVDPVAPVFQGEPVDVVIKSFRKPSLIEKLLRQTPKETVVTCFTVSP